MMNPFKVGDKVHHIQLGEVVVANAVVAEETLVQPDSGKPRWEPNKMLSFKPWPAACHVRPFKAVLQKGDKLFIVHCTGEVAQITVHEELAGGVITSYGNEFSKRIHTFHRIGETIQFN